VKLSSLLFFFLFCYTSSWAGTERERFYEFTFPWDDTSLSSVHVGRQVLDPPSGKHGPVFANGDKLSFQDGTTARFFGVGVAVSSEFPPSVKEDTRVFVSRLAKYGINHIRINGIDFERSGIFSHWYRTGKLDHPLVDRIDYLIAELRKQGIYYSVSLNNNTAKYESIKGLAKNKRTPKHNNRKVIQIYGEDAVAVAGEWVRSYMGHKNPYTGITLAEDSANIYFAAVNEDSVFSEFYKDYRKLGDEGKRLLETRFNKYLAQKYGKQKSLESAWTSNGRKGLGQEENLGDETVKLLGATKLKESTLGRQQDTVRFLIDTDIAYGESIKDILDDLGYRGLFTITNNWFGYANLYANWAVGNYIDMHSYYDHPRRLRGEREVHETISNMSYIQDPAIRRKGYTEPNSKFVNHIFRDFTSALTDRPLIVSEWNHSGWSDYAYEGPLLMTVYSAFQGYPLLDLHTMFSTGKGIRSEYSTKAFAVIGNQVINALLPSLSMAFVKGMISEGKEPLILDIDPEGRDFMGLVIKGGMSTGYSETNVPPGTGFIRRVRHTFTGQQGEKTTSQNIGLPRDLWQTDTGEIKWDVSSSEKSMLSANTPKFQAVAGQLGQGDIKLGNTIVSVEDHGVVTLVALDDQPLNQSRRILLTVVSSFRNTGNVFRNVSETGGKARRVVEDPGHLPVRLKRLNGLVRIQSVHKGMPTVYAIGPKGNRISVAGVTGKSIGEQKEISVPVGGVDSPWYMIEYENII